MARPQEDRQRPVDDEWTTRHREEIAQLTGPSVSQFGRYDPRLAPRMETPTPAQSASDPASALSFLPAWAQGVGDFAGEKLRGAMGLRIGDAEPVKGAFEGMNWLGEHVSDPTVGGATAVLGDTFDNLGRVPSGSGFGGAYSQTKRAQEIGAKAYKEEKGEAARRVREDPNAPMNERLGAFGFGAASLGGDFAAPVLPGAGLVIGPLKAAAKAGLAARAARIAGDAAHLDPEQLAARIGAVSPAQGHADNLVGEGAPRIDGNLALDPAPSAPRAGDILDFPGAQNVGPQPTLDFGAELAKAAERKQRRMERVVGKVQKGETVNAKEASELLDYLSTEVPEQVADFERVLRPVIDEQAAIAAARKGMKDADKAERGAEREMDKAGSDYARAEQSVLRAERRADNAQDRIDAQEARAQGRAARSADRASDSTEAKFAERLDTARQNVEAKRAEVDAADGVNIARTVVRLSREDAERLATRGYSSEKDVALLERSGINVGKFDPDEAAQLAKTITEHPDEFDAATRTMSYPEQLRKGAQYLGASEDDLMREMARRGLTRGDQSAFLIGANLTITRLGREFRDLVRSGAPKEAQDAAYAQYAKFAVKVGGANSEAGRSLGALRLTRSGAIAENIHRANIVTSATKNVARMEADLAKAQAKVEGLAKDAEAARAAVDMVRDARAKGIAEAFAKKREDALAKAQADIATREAKVTAARESYGRAVEKAREAAEAAEAAAFKAATKGGVDKVAAKALLEIDPDDALALANAMRNLHKASKGEQMVAIMANNVFSGIQALEANAIGGALRVAERAFLTPLVSNVTAPIIAKITGRPSAVASGETVRTFASLFSGAPGAFRSFSRTMLEGMDETSARMQDVSKARPFPGKKGLLAEWALRMNGGADAAARHLVREVEMRNIAQREAERELGRGHPALASRAAQIIADPPKHVLEEITRMTQDVSYGGKLGEFSEKVFGVINHRVNLPALGATPVLKPFFLAARFVWAATGFSLEMSGGGLVRAVTLARKGGEFDRQAAISGARGMVGGTFLMGGLALYGQGGLMGKDPEGLGRDDSIRLPNGEWMPLRPFWPLSGGFLYAARLGDASKDVDGQDHNLENKVVRGIMGVGDAMLNQPVLRFSNDILDAVQRGENAFVKYWGTWLGTRGTPSGAFLRDLDRMFDNTLKDPDGFFENMIRNIPVLNDSLQPVFDKKGEPKTLRGGAGIERLNPFRSEFQPPDPVEQRLAPLKEQNPRTGSAYFTVAELKDEVAGVKLGGQWDSRWQEIGGKSRWAAITKATQEKDFATLPLEDQAARLRKAAGVGIAQAKKQLASELLGVVGDQVNLPRDGEEIASGVALLVSSEPSRNGRLGIIEGALQWRKNDPRVIEALAAKLPKGTKDKPEPTLEQYIKHIPLVREYEKMPTFADGLGNPIGTKKEWDRYAKLKKDYAAIGKRKDLSEVDRRMAQARFRIEHLSDFTFFYNRENGRGGGANPKRTDMKERYPDLEKFLDHTPDE